jgi:N-acetylglutamate synthase-like GNAT family acetyltransferase
MKIREINEGDLDKLLELYKDLHENDEPLPEKDIIQSIWSEIQNNKNFICYGVFIGEQLVCSCCLVLTINLTRGCRPYGMIENVVTHNKYRRRGYGLQILKHSLSEAWQRNCYKVMLLTGRLNEETFKFYESAGFDRYVKQAFIAKP